MSEQLYAVIDVETTGGTPYNSRITDISIFLTNGHEVIDEFSSLVNPELYIPPYITQLTGINNEMVATAPTFDEIARQIIDITEGATFVAHNVNFDYGMIQGEFRRYQYPYEREKLCTVRLAKAWMPGHQSYGLGRICHDLNIPIHGRHRARGDAEATVELFHRIYDLSDGVLSMADQRWVQALPETLDKKAVTRIPESAGLYFFYNDQGKVLLVGSSVNLYKKVVSLIKSKAQINRKILAETVDIDFELTGSELIAGLKLPTAIGKHEPAYNKKPKEQPRWQITRSVDLFGYLQLGAKSIATPVVGETFKSRSAALKYLEKLQTNHQLCAKLCGLDVAGCNMQSSINCPGACEYLEPAELYNQRVALALNSQYEGDYIILDQIDDQEYAFVLVENNDYQGYGVYSVYDEGISSYEELKQLMTEDDSSFEKCALVHDFLRKKKGKVIKAQFSATS